MGTDANYLQETADRWRHEAGNERTANRILRAAVWRAHVAGMSQAAISRATSVRRATIQEWLK